MINSLVCISKCLQSLRSSKRLYQALILSPHGVRTQPSRYFARVMALYQPQLDPPVQGAFGFFPSRPCSEDHHNVAEIIYRIPTQPCRPVEIGDKLFSKTGNSTQKAPGIGILSVQKPGDPVLRVTKISARSGRWKRGRPSSSVSLSSKSKVLERCKTFGKAASSRIGVAGVRSDSTIAWQDESPIPLPPKYGPSRRIRSSHGKGWSFLHVGIIQKIPRLRGPKIEVSRHKVISLRPLRPFGKGEREHGGGHGLDHFSSSWSIRYAVIADRTHSLDLWPTKRSKREVLRKIGLNMDRSAIVRRWLHYEPFIRLKTWERFMLLALQRSPERALRALDVVISCSVPNVPKYMVEDCLDHLGAAYLEGVKTPSRLAIDKIHRLLCDLVESSCLQEGKSGSMRQRTIYLVLHHSDTNQAQSLYKVLCDGKISLHPMTLLHFLAKFIDIGHIPLSLEVMQKISSSGYPLSTDAVQSGCVKLIRARINTEDGNFDKKEYRFQTYILAQIIQMGIRPGIAMYNAIILNAVEACEYQSALRLYEAAVEFGLKPDGTTYGILLKGAKQNLDYRIAHMVVRDAEADGTLRRDSRLVYDLLYVTLKLEQSTTQSFLFDTLLQIYKKYCDLRLLQDLGLLEPTFNTSVASDHPIISPSSRIIGLMLMVYIKQHCYSYRLVNLYHRYRSYVEQGHPEIAATAETDHVVNAFILAFGRQAQTLQIATNVVKDMLKTDTANPPSPIHCKFVTPTVQTWSILLACHIRNNQAKAAEKILIMMRDRHIRPNQVTWNGLISGYAAMQDIYKAVDAVKRMEAESFEIDSYTLKGLGRFRNRTRLLQVLDDNLGDELEAEEGQDMEVQVDDPK